MGLVEVNCNESTLFVAVLSKGGILLGNSVPTPDRAEAERCLAALGGGECYERTRDVLFDAIVGGVLVDLFYGRPGAWERAEVLPLDSPGDILCALRRVPPGEVVTYGELAELSGKKGAARTVGTAMRKNRWPLIVPCHRVVKAGGKLGGFSGSGGVSTKAALLKREADMQKREADMLSSKKIKK